MGTSRIALALVIAACAHSGVRVVWATPDGRYQRVDHDGDGFAGPWECAPGIEGCNADALNQSGYELANLDCNDDDASIHPGAVDRPGDGIDQNCDGADGVRGEELKLPNQVKPKPASLDGDL